MAAGQGGRNSRADLRLGLGGSRDTRQGLHSGQKYKYEGNQNILNQKFLTNWPRSVERRSVLSTGSTHSTPPLQPDSGQSLRCKCFVWSSQAVEWKIVIIIAKNCWQLYIKAWEIYEKEILDCFAMTKPGKESVKSDSFSISLTQQLACFFRVHLLETGYCGLWIIVKYCEVLSVLLFVSGMAGVAIYYLRYCYHASLIGPVHNYAQSSTGAQTEQN